MSELYKKTKLMTEMMLDGDGDVWLRDEENSIMLQSDEIVDVCAFLEEVLRLKRRS